jgi:alpha-1,4-digalacturonate transport system permease protein
MNKLLKYATLLAVSLVFLFPILWVLLSSLKPQSELFTYPLTIVPRAPSLANYVTAFASGDFLNYFKNSIIVSTASTLLTIAINVMAGYALSKYYFRGRDLIFYLMVGTLMIPLQAIMVPIFLLLKDLGMLNTLWGIIIPPAATPTGVFLARQYIQTIPDSFIEAARIDGGGEFLIFRRIVVPLATPIIATLAIFSFMWRWNDFLWPFIVITRKANMTLQLALANFVGQYQINWANLLAMTVVTMVPMILVFLALQRYFVTGLTAGGVKA